LLDIYINRNKADKNITLTDLNKKIINVDIFVRRDVENLILKSYFEAINYKKDFRLILFRYLLCEGIIFRSLIKMDIRPREVLATVNQELKNTVENDKDELKKYIKELLSKAFLETLELRNNQVTKSALFLSLINDQKGGMVNVVINRYPINHADMSNALILLGMPVPNVDHLTAGVGDFFKLRMKYGYKFKIDRAFMSRPTRYLDKVSIDLTALAQRMKIGFLIGHDREFDQMMNVLLRPGLNNVMLIGEPGSGKETMVMYLAMKIVYDEVPKCLFDKRLIMLNIGEVTQGAQNVGELQSRLSNIVKEVIEAGNIILYIPNIYNLKQTNIENTGINAADFLKQIFQSSLVPIIGSTTALEYHTIIEKDAEFCNIFEKIKMEEITENEAVKILSYEALALERQSGVVITYKAIKRAVMLAKRYITDKLLPSSASDLIKETISYVKSNRRKVICEDDVILMVENKTHIPVSKVTKNESANLLDLENTIHQKLIDQEEAVTAVANAIREYRAGLSKSKGPIATFLFVGPTGVGKTELSKILANTYFGSEEKMIRFDMSEFQDEESISRFIGSTDGKISGLLTEAVKNNPFSLVLLDEFEKANSKILNLFLAVFDEGRLTDSTGRLIDFNNTIIICTSNALSDYIKKELDKGTSYIELSEQIKNKLTNVYRPELLNRFSKVLVFKPLLMEHILQIAKLNISKLKTLLLREQGIYLEVSDDAIVKLTEIGFDPVFGARPLEGVIRDKIKSKLSEAILKDELKKSCKAMIVLENDKFVLKVLKDDKINIKNENSKAKN
jgi:ATP-dependent Clp protease ATP-binding subunit ClpC